MFIELIRVVQLPDTPKANTIYMEKIPGNHTLCRLTVVGNTPADVRHVAGSSTSSTAISNGDVLHPELNLFEGC